MDRIFIIVFVLLQTFITYSQQIDENWFFRSGVTITQVHTFDPNPSAFDINQFGEDQIWDFSNEPINNLIDTTWYLNPEEMSFIDYFPEAMIGKRNISPFYDWEYYYRIEGDTIYDLGEAFIRHVGNSVDTTILALNGIESVFMINDFMLTDTLWNSEDNMITNVQFFGKGTVINSPQDTFENCVMFKFEFPQLNDYKYIWYQENLMKEIAVYVPEESAAPNASLTRLVDYEDLEEPPSSTNQLQKLEDIVLHYSFGNLELINNGAQRDFHLSLFTVDGKKLSSQLCQISNGHNIINLNVDHKLQAGFVFLVDLDSKLFLSQKVIFR